MNLPAGTRLGPYEVVSLIGKGGMGAVHKATDTRLGRHVAIKMLSASGDGNRDRLVREARVVAALQHPHVCTLHDVGSHEGADYLVMEHVEGHTLKGPLPLEKVIEYGMQIADALDAAHARGITHRDLKPANIMVTRSGIKVLDFGVAQMTGLDSLTRTGQIVGTPAYMAPEQWAGAPTDSRTDIYALGLVLTELVTGSREPGQTLEPAALDAIVKGCLEKDPDRRWQSARDIRRLLSQVSTAPAAIRSAPARRGWMALIPIALMAGTIAGWLMKPSPTRDPLHVSLAPPPGSTFVVGRNYEGGIAVSPDGKALAFIANTDGRAHLWIKRFDSPEARLIHGTDGAFLPFWSPDSSEIAFYTADRLSRVTLTTGVVTMICATDPRANGGAWLSNNVLLIAGRPGGGIHSISAGGGESRQVVDGAWPSALPGGKRFIYMASDGVRIASIDAPGDSGLVEGVPRVRALYSEGHLFYPRDRTLLAQPFDPDTGAIAGEPIPVAQSLLLLPIAASQASFSPGPDGLLVFAGGDPLTRLRWRDRTGRPIGDLGPPAQYLTPRISPDGTRVAYTRFEGRAGSIWIAAVDSSTGQSSQTRLTFETTVDRYPIWSPDGKTITYTSGQLGTGDLLRKLADGTGVAERLTNSPTQQHAMDWSSDGQYLSFTRNDPVRGTSLHVLPMSSGVPYLMLETPVSEAHSQFDPATPTRWIAYSSDDTGRREIYVAPFRPGQPASGVRTQVSIDGGTMPRWRRDGRELYYWGLDGRIMAAAVDGAGAAFQVRQPQPLFQAHRPTQRTNDIEFDVTSDGARFLLIEPSEATSFQSLSVVMNWRARLP